MTNKPSMTPAEMDALEASATAAKRYGGLTMWVSCDHVLALLTLARRAEAAERELSEAREFIQEQATHPTGGTGCNPRLFVERARAFLERTAR